MALRSGKMPTTSVRRRISLLRRSFIRPSSVGSTRWLARVSAVEAVQVVGEGVGDAGVAGGFIGPAAGLSIGLEGLDVGELIGEGAAELGCCDVVVAGFADVGIRAGAGGRVAGAVTLRDTSFSISLCSQPTFSGTMGLPTGVRVNWRRILPIASS